MAMDTTLRTAQTDQVPARIEAGGVLLRDMAGDGSWLAFDQPVAVHAADTVDAVVSVLQSVDDALDQGLYAAGYLSYEAAPAFDPALRAHAPGDLISRETAMTVLMGAGLTLDDANAVFKNNEELLGTLKRRLEST